MIPPHPAALRSSRRSRPASGPDAMIARYRRLEEPLLVCFLARGATPLLAADLAAEALAAGFQARGTGPRDLPEISSYLAAAREVTRTSRLGEQVEHRARQALGLESVALSAGSLARVAELLAPGEMERSWRRTLASVPASERELVRAHGSVVPGPPPLAGVLAPSIRLRPDGPECSPVSGAIRVPELLEAFAAVGRRRSGLQQILARPEALARRKRFGRRGA